MKADDAATCERARRLANLALWTIQLQRRRLNSVEPEDAKFIFRKWSDFHFFIVALTRLRKAVTLATGVPEIANVVGTALRDFDAALPNLAKMRNVAEHIDDYAVDKGRDKSISRKSLEVSSGDADRWEWLGFELDAKEAVSAGARLFKALQLAAASLQAAEKAAHDNPRIG